MKKTKKIQAPATIEDVGLQPDVAAQYASAMIAEGEKYKKEANLVVANLCLLTRAKKIKLVDVARNLDVTAPTVQNYKKKGTATLANAMRWASVLGYDLILVKRVVAGQDDDSTVALQTMTTQ